MKYTGRYVVLFKEDATTKDLDKLKSIEGFSFPDDKKSYDDSFDKLKVIIGEFDEQSRKILEEFTEPEPEPDQKSTEAVEQSTEPVEKSTKFVEFVHQEYILPAPTLSTPEVPYGVARLTNPQPDPDRVPGPANGGQGVDIYVIDSGVRINHSEFGGRAHWTDFETDNSPVFLPALDPREGNIHRDDHVAGIGHGTHVAGIAAGKTCGVARAATIIAIKVFARGGDVDDADIPDNAPTGLIMKAILWVGVQAGISNRPSIINYSMDGIRPPFLMRLLMLAATRKGVHFVHAAGNANENLPARPNNPLFPDHVIYVGASDWQNKRWRVTDTKGSAYGRGTDVFAPGAFIISARHDDVNGFKTMSGTSMAAPHVAGLIARLISAEPGHPSNRNPNLMKARVLALAAQVMDFTDDAALVGTNTTTRLAHI